MEDEPKTGGRSGMPESLSFCRHLTEHSPLPTAALSGPDHIVQYANPAFCRLLDKKCEDLLGFPFADVVPEAKDYLAALDRVRRTSRPEFGTEDQQSAQHEGYWTYGLWAVLKADKSPLGIMIQLTDTTEAAQYREQATAVNQELLLTAVRQHEQSEEQRELLCSMLENVPMAVYFKDADGRFTRINPQAEQTMGIDPVASLGHTARDLFPEEAAEVVMRSDREVLEQGAPVQHEELLRYDDAEHWCLSTKFPLRDASGEIVGLCGMSLDITERKRMEQQLRQAKDAAETASAAKDQFLAALSHELRTPLTPVLAAISMLQRDSRLDPGVRAVLESVRRNVDIEARLIDDLLDVTRVVRGKVALDREPVELTEILQSAAEICAADIREQKLKFRIEAPDGPYPLEGDRVRLQQVFWNLLKNAVKFTPPGGCVGIRCRREGDAFAIVDVDDSGRGIPPEVLPLLFQPFEQGEAQTKRLFGGLGLGLVICKGLVEQHGGTIEAHSEGEGRGASFRVRLPLLSNTHSSRSDASAESPEPPQPEPRPLHILYVEDHDDTAALIRNLLEMEGHEVQTAGDVAAALDVASRGEFDVVVSDLSLPDGTGLDLMRGLRAQGRTWPGIVLTGHGNEHNIRASQEAGFAVHLVKPVGVEQLLDALAQVTTDLE